MSDPKDLRRAKRLVIVSRSNGISSASIGVIALIVALVARDILSVLAAVGICAAAGLEIAGSFRAGRRDPSAPRLLVASQAVSLLSLLGILVRCTVAINPATLLGWMPESYRESILIIYPGPGEAEAFLRVGLRFTLGMVALVAAIYEIGMATYYASATALFLRLSAGQAQRT